MFIKKGLEHHVMFLGCSHKTIRFRPALIMEQQHIDEGIDVIEKIINII
jgi:L-lysine 6-transaminase